MIEIVGVPLTQWDVNRKVEVTGEAEYVHFANAGDSKAVKLPLVDGLCEIPEYLLQTGKALNVYAVLKGVTLESRSFAVRKRERPEDYIYKPDQRDYIYTLIDEANEAIKNANDAAEEAREAAENCSGGGGTEVLNVFVEGNEADHTSMEIYEHVDHYRGLVQLNCEEGYYQLLHANTDTAFFGYIADEQLLKVVIIYGNNVERYEHYFASIDNINEAIGDLVKTVNGISPDKNGNVEIETIGAGVFYVDIVPQTDDPEIFEIVANWDDVLNAYNSGMDLVLRKQLYHITGIMVGYKAVHLTGIKVSNGKTIGFIFNDMGGLVEHAVIEGQKAVWSIPYEITDSSLSKEGKPADAKAVGEELGNISTALDHIIALQEELIG